MPYRFDAFDLDENTRMLSSADGELRPQPLIFDLLLHLIRNRSRIVSKDELVENVWEGAFVTDAAVQRAVSVLRGVLREGGTTEAIRTYPRQGYRFCKDVEERPAGEDQLRKDGEGPLERARSCFSRDDWPGVIEHSRQADEYGGLSGADLEAWGHAAEHMGQLAAAIVPWERAVAAFTAANRPGDAGRVALRLANTSLERREASIARGWLRRAERYLQGIERVHEHALLEWLRARFALFSGKLDEALDRAAAARHLARELGDRDVEALGLLYEGLSQLALGRDVTRSVELLDEAGAAVLGGELRPWTGGIIYCGVIWSCMNRGDWRRAAEWADQFGRWCSTKGVCAYPGICRLHRAEILCISGNLDDSEREARLAALELSESAPFTEGEAYRLIGEVRLAKRDFGGARSAFYRAHELGWDPNPGYAMLLHAEGRGEEAMRALETALLSTEWAVGQRRGFLLSHLAAVAASIGRPDRARVIVEELNADPEVRQTLPTEAMFCQARGELALVEGDPSRAAAHFGEAIVKWRDVGAPLKMADARLRLASALSASGDVRGAELELAAARTTYERAAGG